MWSGFTVLIVFTFLWLTSREINVNYVVHVLSRYAELMEIPRLLLLL